MDFSEFFRDNLKIAYGCTEPVAVALAASHAARLIKEKKFRKIEIITDRNIFKNGFGAGIPNSNGMIGNVFAASLGAFIADPDKGFSIFNDIPDNTLKAAEKFFKEKRISISVDKSKTGIYIFIKIYTYDDDYAVAIVKDDHLGICKLIKNGQEIFSKEKHTEKKKQTKFFEDVSIDDLVNHVSECEISLLKPVQKALDVNMEASKYGIANPSGIKLGNTLKKMWDDNTLCHNAENMIKYSVAAACDARMGGESVPVMTLCGSGNQGIAATIPIFCWCDFNNIKDKNLILRATALSCLITGFIKERLGKLSPICGCVAASGSGAAAGITFINGHPEKTGGTIANLLADITGVICDGAKGSCSLKLSTACGMAPLYSTLAINGCIVDEKNGIIEDTIEKTIENLREVAQDGMALVDEKVVNIFEKKISLSDTGKR